MTETEKLIRDINTLRESIQTDWVELESKPLSQTERAEIRRHIDACQIELKGLLKRVWSLDDGEAN